MRALLLVLLALAAGTAAGVYLHDRAGYVLVSFGPWVLETSVLGFVVCFAVTFLLLYYGLKLVIVTLRLPTTIRSVLQDRRMNRARESFELGVQQLLSGYWKRAEIELIRRAADHQAGVLNHLLAARAADRLGAPERRNHYLQLAAAEGPAAEFAALLCQAELSLAHDQPATARSVLLRLHERDPKHPYVIELLAETYTCTQEWDALRKLLIVTEPLHALPPDRHRAHMTRALCALMDNAAADARLDSLKTAWEATPAAFRGEPAVRRAHIRGLARLNADAEAIAQINAVLQQEWDGELVTLYGQLHASDPVSQLAAVEQWLSQYGERAELLMVAAQACLQNKLWGKARSYLEGAIRIRPTAAAYLELARLCYNIQQPDDAARYYKQGLELTEKTAQSP